MVYIIRSFLKNKQNTTKQTDRNDGEEESTCWPGEQWWHVIQGYDGGKDQGTGSC